MFDKFDLWKWEADHNCWDYVREYLIERIGVPHDDVPKYGIAPHDKRAMTKASQKVTPKFIDCEPKNGAIACHYHGKCILHVGVVEDGFVRHCSKEWGTIKESIKRFENRASKTVYKIHASLKYLR